MVDLENAIFSTVATALRTAFTGIYVASEILPAPAIFPAVFGREMDNSVYERTMDSSNIENHVSVMWQWEAVSALPSECKTQCKSIISTIDTQMAGMGFIRIGSTPVELTTEKGNQYRMIARYRAVISKDNVIYRR